MIKVACSMSAVAVNGEPDASVSIGIMPAQRSDCIDLCICRGTDSTHYTINIEDISDAIANATRTGG